MNILETIDHFNAIKEKVAQILNADLEDLKAVTYFNYVESTYNGYVYGSTMEEWLEMVIPLYMDKK